MHTPSPDPPPLAAVRPCPGHGRIGLDDRGPHPDAAAALDAAAAWGAAAVVTLIGDRDGTAVVALGEAIAARHMDWLPVPPPVQPGKDAGFEAAWAAVADGLRARLRDGADIMVQGDAAGAVAARLLVEFGTTPEAAIAEIRRIRPEGLASAATERLVFAGALQPDGQPDRAVAARRDRAVGALLGLAVGDAVGTTLEFERRDDRAPRLTDMVGGGPFGLKPGEWTDDTAMALALAESLRTHPTLNERDLMNRFVNWYRHGAHSCTGTCFDIGNTVRGALDRFTRSGDPVAGETHAHAAGNGSLMRLAPVAVRHWHDAARRRDVAARQSRTTHGADEAVDACVVYADLLAEAIAGVPRSAVMRPRSEPYAGRIGPIAAGGWRGKPRAQVRGSGYVADALEAALWCVGRTADFRSAVLLAANLREDADTTAAIAGQLAGALYGAAGIPSAWRATVAWRETIEALAAGLFEAGEAESGAEKRL